MIHLMLVVILYLSPAHDDVASYSQLINSLQQLSLQTHSHLLHLFLSLLSLFSAFSAFFHFTVISAASKLRYDVEDLVI